MNKRITIFAGHYGSGKTNLALNYAFHLRKKHENVVVCDLDIVNPYFRTKDSVRELEEAEIRLISPKYANTNVDIPSLPAEVAWVFRDERMQVVIDVGGDDSGAVALGQYADDIKTSGYDMLLVFNKRRYLTSSSEEASEILRDIEKISHLRFTGVVNNTNLAKETTREIVLEGEATAKELSDHLSLSLLFTSFEESVDVSEALRYSKPFPIKIFRKPGWYIF
ncbi:MAG: hypothetical protein GX633_00450 [Clostridiales bacterium]|jgi:DNA helicase HerA-like ATPase|nr:hypothetical protein [Clostridiales bacterium]